MPTVSSLIIDYHAHSKTEQNAFLAVILSRIPAGSNMKTYIEALRFSKRRVCPHCGSVHVVKNGKRPNCTRRCFCRDCRKRFVSTVKSIVEKSRKPLHT